MLNSKSLADRSRRASQLKEEQRQREAERQRAAEEAARLNAELQRRAEEALREAAERQREAIEQARRLEAQRTQQLEAERALLRHKAKKLVDALFRKAVRAANERQSKVVSFASPRVSEFLEMELAREGFSYSVRRTSNLRLDIEMRLKPMLELLRVLGEYRGLTPSHCADLERAIEESFSPEGDVFCPDPILEVFWEIESDDWKAWDSFDDMKRWHEFKKRVGPRLKREECATPLDEFRLNWGPIELTEEVAASRGKIPAWLLSTGGQWLMQRVGECAALEADAERRQVVFHLIAVPVNQDRWGLNAMTKFVYREQPIGVTPFSAEAMQELFDALDFRTQLTSSQSGKVIKVAW